jgi:Fe2+ transport system protein B
MADIKQMPKEYGEMIYSLLTEMNGALMAQSRAINNNLSNSQRTMLDLQVSINNLILGLKETRDKRYQEEIDNLEIQMQALTVQLNEKRNAITLSTTSEKMRTVVQEVITQREQAEQKRHQIDWIDVRNKVVPYVIGALALIIVMSIIPQFGQWLTSVFAPK